MAWKRAAAGHPLNGYGMKIEEVSGDDGIHEGLMDWKPICVISIVHFKSPILYKIDIVPTLMRPPGLAEAVRQKSIGFLLPAISKSTNKLGVLRGCCAERITTRRCKAGWRNGRKETTRLCPVGVFRFGELTGAADVAVNESTLAAKVAGHSCIWRNG
jgi:hypothetical protein